MQPNQISTIFGYQTSDGQQFFTLPEAQKHARRGLYAILFDRAVAANLDFARLDKNLMLDFLMTGGSAVAKIALDGLEAAPPKLHTGGTVSDAQVRKADGRPVAEATTFPFRRPDILKSAMNAVDDSEREAAEKRSQEAHAKFGKHPLDPAPARSEGMEPVLKDDDIYAEVADMMKSDAQRGGAI